MATELGTAYLSLTVSTRSLAKDTAKAFSGVDTAATKAGKSAGSRFTGALKKWAAPVAAGALIGTALSKGLARSISIENAQAKLTGLGHSAGDVTKIMGNALASVKGTAYGLGDAATVAASLSASGVKSGKQLEGVLKTVADTATISGRSMTDIGAIFGSVAARGKLQGDDMLQLMSSGVPVLQFLSKQLGKTTADVSEMVTKGQVDFGTFAAAMQKGLGGAALASGKTFQGSLANVQAALGRLGETAATPALASLKTIFNDATPAIDAITAKIGPLVTTLADKLGPVVDELSGKFFDLVTNLASGKGLSGELGGLAAILNPVGAIFKGMLPALTSAGDALSDIGKAVGGALAAVLPVIADAFATLGKSLGGAVAQILPALVPVFTTLGDAIVLLAPALGSIAKALSGALAKVLPVVALAFAEIATALAGSLADALPTLVPLFESLAQAIINLTPALVVALPLLASLASWAISIVGNLASSKVAVLGIAGAFVAWKTIPATIAGVRAAMALFQAVQLGVTAATYGAQGAMVVAGASAKIYGAIMKTQSIISKAVAAGQWLINAALSANPIGIVIVAISALVAGLVIFFTKTKTGQKIIKAAWSAIKTAISAVGDWFIKTLVPGMMGAIDKIGDAFTSVKDRIGRAWNGIKFGLKAGWDWIGTYVFGPFKKGIYLLGDAFARVERGISKAWDGIKKATAKPVNFVLETVYNNGIRSWWNTIADAVGLKSLELPAAQTVAYANGTEDHRAQIARGGAMRLWAEPETGGEAYIPLASSKRGRSTAILGEVARRFGYGLTQFKHGGLWDNAGGAWSKAWRGTVAVAGDAWDKAKAAGGAAWDFIRDPAGTVTKGLGSVVSKLLGPIGDSSFAALVSTLPKKFVGGLASTVGKMFSGGGEGRASSGGTIPRGNAIGWRAMEDVLRAGIPGVSFSSAYRPGAVTSLGVQSMHALGRAVDIVPPSMRVFNWIDSHYPNSAELLYSPAGGRQIVRGSKGSFRTDTTRWPSIHSMHYNHVHWAMADGGIIPTLYDKGGVLPKGVSVVRNKTHKPEAIFTQAQLKSLLSSVANAATSSREVLSKSVTSSRNKLSSATIKAVTKEADGIIAARRRANDRIKKANAAAATKRDKALAAADKISDSKKRAAAKRRVQATYKAEKKALLPSISRADAEKQARKNISVGIAASKKVDKALAAQQKTTKNLWDDGTYTGKKGDRRNGLNKGTVALLRGKTKGVTLADFAKSRENIAARLEKEKDKLKDLKESWASLSSSVASQITGELDLSKGISEATEDQIVQVTRTNSRGETWNEDKLVKGKPAKATFASVAETVKSLAAKAKTFAQKLQALVKKGIPAGLVQEVASLGTEQGIQVADALLSGTSAQVKQLASDYSSLNTWSSNAGSYVADQMYGAGIQAQQGLIKGLQKDDKKLEQAAEHLANRVVVAAKKKLGIKSPSRVFRDEVGLNITRGVAKGLDKGQRALDARLSTLVDPGRATSRGRMSLDGTSGRAQALSVHVDNVVAVDPDATVRKLNTKLADALAVTGIGRTLVGV